MDFRSVLQANLLVLALSLSLSLDVLRDIARSSCSVSFLLGFSSAVSSSLPLFFSPFFFLHYDLPLVPTPWKFLLAFGSWLQVVSRPTLVWQIVSFAIRGNTCARAETFFTFPVGTSRANYPSGSCIPFSSCITPVTVIPVSCRGSSRPGFATILPRSTDMYYFHLFI